MGSWFLGAPARRRGGQGRRCRLRRLRSGAKVGYFKVPDTPSPSLTLGTSWACGPFATGRPTGVPSPPTPTDARQWRRHDRGRQRRSFPSSASLSWPCSGALCSSVPPAETKSPAAFLPLPPRRPGVPHPHVRRHARPRPASRQHHQIERDISHPAAPPLWLPACFYKVLVHH
jgi:hypothetical protein